MHQATFISPIESVQCHAATSLHQEATPFDLRRAIKVRQVVLPSSTEEQEQRMRTSLLEAVGMDLLLMGNRMNE